MGVAGLEEIEDGDEEGGLSEALVTQLGGGGKGFDGPGSARRSKASRLWVDLGAVISATPNIRMLTYQLFLLSACAYASLVLGGWAKC